jgi:2'-5' RNA ligase
MPEAPLILTLKLDPKSQNFFNELRRLHFPPERNYLDAHLTLFHQLPTSECKIVTDIEQWCSGRNAMALQVNGIVSIGNGTAYKIDCEELIALHQYLQIQWQPWLIPQDKQKLWPHITIQNKVNPEKAKTLKEQLLLSFKPFEATGMGLVLWEYLGGPWKMVREFEFGNARSSIID